MIEESEAPKGYLLSNKTETVTLSYADQKTNIVYGSATMINEEPTRFYFGKQNKYKWR